MGADVGGAAESLVDVVRTPPPGLRTLLDRAFRGDVSDEDEQHALGGLHLVVRDGDRLVAHAAVVERTLHVGDRALRAGYLEAVAVLPSHQRRGLGSRVVAEASRRVRQVYDVGALSTGEHAFYERLGWERWRGPVHVVVDGRWVRAPDEDDAVMVLHCGVPLDLSAPVAVDERPGDDW